MPTRRAPDQGIKPFEFRVGVGGLPTLGGMFRGGDPATTPPHKFHLLVNMRKRPAGLITRPGLTLEFNTGVEECINGLTEDPGLQGGALMLYPGAEAAEDDRNAATFRAIFPDSSIDYSEFAFALYGPAAAVRGTSSPVLAYTAGPNPLPGVLSRPFIFRGQAVQFVVVDRNGVDTVALLGISLAQRSFLQASNCWRNVDGPVGDPGCPGAAGLPTPPAASDPPLWPFQHPVGSVELLTYFDNPFGNTTPWTVLGDRIITIPERNDSPSGEAGIVEVLYFVANQGTNKLVRWDGVRQSNENIAIPVAEPVLTEQAYGPCLINASDVDDDPNDWGAFRDETGSWVTIEGAYPFPVGSYNLSLDGQLGVSWGGRGCIIVNRSYNIVVSVTEFSVVKIDLFSQGAATFDSGPFAVNIVNNECETPCSVSAILLAAKVSGERVYALIELSNSLGGSNNGVFVRSRSVPLGGGGPSLKLGVTSGTLWLQAVGSRVYVGGKFNEWDPILQVAEPGIFHHGVYDVTDVAAPVLAYRVNETQQLYDEVTERYSIGALEAVPNDESGGEGFQAS